MKPDTPIVWLFGQLDTLLSPATMTALRHGYAEQIAAYNRRARLREARRELALYEMRITTYGPDTTTYRRLEKKIARRKALIERLDNDI